MQHYELLCVLPGTLSEQELDPVIRQITKALEDAGGSEINPEPTNKSRLAYPMKHIRYGYFQLIYFKAAPEKVPTIYAKLRLIDGPLRIIIHTHNPATKPAQRMVLAGVSNPVMSRGEDQQDREEEPAVQTQKMSRGEDQKQGEVTHAAQTTATPVNLDDINKKLDQLLESDISGV